MRSTHLAPDLAPKESTNINRSSHRSIRGACLTASGGEADGTEQRVEEPAAEDGEEEGDELGMVMGVS